MSSMLPPEQPGRWPGDPDRPTGAAATPPPAAPPAPAPPSEPPAPFAAPGPDPAGAHPQDVTATGADPTPGAWPTVVETTGRGSGKGLLYGLVGGGAVGLLALGAAGVWAWSAVGGGGDRPDSALPASTFVYAAVDLDPAAGQKVEAFRTLAKFPAFTDAGVDENGELSGSFWDTVFDGDSCTNLDPAKDVSPWLGKRAAVAGVTLGDDEVPVGVVQVTDEAAAPAGLLALKACEDNGDADATDGVTASWVVRDGWAYIAKDTATAQQVADAAAAGPTLVDDAEYARWTDEVGDQGVVSAYLAPKAGERLAALGDVLGVGPTGSAMDPSSLDAELGSGVAMTLRFADGGLEIAAASAVTKELTGSAAGAGASLATLPDDTLAAFGVSPADGWADAMAENLSERTGGEVDADAILDELGKETGLSLPADLETLAGRTSVLSVGGDLDVDAFTSGTGDPTAFPVAAKVTGDQSAIKDVLYRLGLVDPSVGEILGSTPVGDDTVVIGPDEAYRQAVAKGGRLGDDEAFRSVVPHADDAVVAFYLDLDGADGWFARLAEDDREVARNLEPLAAVGLSAWVDDDVVHTRIRATTD